VRAEDVEFEFFLDQDREASYLLAKINHIATQMDLDLFDRPDHERLPSDSRRRTTTSAESGVLLSSTSPLEKRSRHTALRAHGAFVLRTAFTKRAEPPVGGFADLAGFGLRCGVIKPCRRASFFAW